MRNIRVDSNARGLESNNFGSVTDQSDRSISQNSPKTKLMTKKRLQGQLIGAVMIPISTTKIKEEIRIF